MRGEGSGQRDCIAASLAAHAEFFHRPTTPPRPRFRTLRCVGPCDVQRLAFAASIKGEAKACLKSGAVEKIGSRFWDIGANSGVGL
jgi:hypothetical protein